MLALLVGNSVRLIEQHLHEQVDARITAIELAYKTAVAPPLAARDYATLRDILDGWRKTEDVRYLAVTDPSGRVLAASGWPLNQALPQAGVEGEVRHIVFNVELLGQRYGEVHYGLSTAFISAATRGLLWQSGLIALAEISLSVLLLSLIGYFLTRHLVSLATASVRVAEGDYDQRMDIAGQDEVAVLAQNFNAMADAVKSRIADLSFQASHDSLTGLFNRRAFENELAVRLEDPATDPERLVLLYLDLDQFKVVNDSCGHAAGDDLLIRLTKVLTERFPDAFLARLGGDEFGLILRDCGEGMALEQANRLIEEICAFPFCWEGRPFRLGASIGMVRASEQLHSVTDLLIAADTACYAAKERGRNRVERYMPTDDWFLQRKEDFRSLPQLTAALVDGRFRLFFQFLEARKPGAMPHAEVLLRLSDTQGKLHAPARFIAAAERYNLMPHIDRWVVENVCRQLQFWQVAEIPLPVHQLTINVSGASLSQEDFPAFVQAQITRHGIDPARLCFEITESCAVENLPLALAFIKQMRALGASMALDDFGSGLSSFGYLKRFEVDYLKIDGLFIRNIDQDRSDRAIAETIVQLARALGLQTVAEYVCSEAVAGVVGEIGVDYVQGYCRHVPEPLENLMAPTFSTAQ